MADLLGVPDEAALAQRAREVAVGLLHPAPRVGGLGDLGVERAVGAHRAEQRQRRVALLLAAQQIEVVLAERGRDVHDAGARVELDEVGRGDHARGRASAWRARNQSNGGA